METKVGSKEFNIWLKLLFTKVDGRYYEKTGQYEKALDRYLEHWLIKYEKIDIR
jgi:hypothetical protein